MLMTVLLIRYMLAYDAAISSFFYLSVYAGTACSAGGGNAERVLGILVLHSFSTAVDGCKLATPSNAPVCTFYNSVS